MSRTLAKVNARSQSEKSTHEGHVLRKEYETTCNRQINVRNESQYKLGRFINNHDHDRKKILLLQKIDERSRNPSMKRPKLSAVTTGITT